MKKISKTKLKSEILKILDIAPFLHTSPEEMYKALLKKYPLKAIEICIDELKKENKLEEEEEFEFAEEKKEEI